ncbi:MAG: DotA/TraY family protein [Bdellovibrionales bacterium]|jgi:conjugal transfer/type IV secretion protein DotA/TraY
MKKPWDKRGARGVLLPLTVVLAIIGSGDLWAAVQDSPLSQAGGADLAGSWLNLLFHGDGETTGGANALRALTGALREALGIYGLSMLTIGGFLLAWQVVTMIAETAQTGVPLGRRTNQLWMPVRFIIGMGLLIPLGGGLNVGQNIIVSVATRGSSLASEAWRGALDHLGDQFSAPLSPHLPDVGRVVATSVEMEICRGLYHHVYTSLQTDPVVAAAGDMLDLDKLPAQRLRDEQWHYTNAFFPEESLCGAYRFAAASGQDELGLSRDNQNADTVVQAARTVAERLTLQSRAVADKVATTFLLTGAQATTPPEMKGYLAGFIKEQTQLIEAKLAQVQKESQAAEAPSSLGWIMAGAFPFDRVREQLALGEVAARSFPKVKAPLLGHSVLTESAWVKAAGEQTSLRSLSAGQLDRYAMLFDRVSEAMKKARGWLYGEQLDDPQTILPDQQDLRDLLSPYTDSEVAQSAFGRLMTIGATSFGVSESIAVGDAYLKQPLQRLAETGRRYLAYGAWAMGQLSPALSEPATIGTALSLAFVAFLFWLAGACLLFLVPLWPFFRFTMAVVAWGLSVLGAVLFLPLVALGHLYPAGDGVVGPLARRAYWMWLGLFIRPCLLLLAFAGGLALFVMGVAFLNVVFFDWFSPLAATSSDIFWFLRAGLALAYAALVLALSNVAFGGVLTFPAKLFDWVGAQSIMPESLVMAGGSHGAAENASTQAPHPMGPAGFMQGVHGVWSHMTGHAAAPASSSSAMTPSRSGATPKDQTAHFPTLLQDKVDHRAEAKAQAQAKAYARADNPATGGRSEAGAFANAATDGKEHKAAAIARHLPDLEDKKNQKLPKMETQVKKSEDKKESAPSESPEQMARALDENATPSSEDKD